MEPRETSRVGEADDVFVAHGANRGKIHQTPRTVEDGGLESCILPEASLLANSRPHLQREDHITDIDLLSAF